MYVRENQQSQNWFLEKTNRVLTLSKIHIHTQKE